MNIMDQNDSLSLFDQYLASPQGAMSPGTPVFSPMMHYGTGLTPQPVQSTDSLSTYLLTYFICPLMHISIHANWLRGPV